MSNQSAEISNVHSGKVVQLFNYLGIDLESAFGNFAMTIIRKGAHITEYFILFILIYNFIEDNFTRKKVYLIAFTIVVLYASSDEIHQIFVPGRAGRITDIGIDTIGAIIAIGLIELKRILTNKLIKNRPL